MLRGGVVCALAASPGGLACAVLDVRARRVRAEWQQPAAPLQLLVARLDDFLRSVQSEPDSPTFRLVTDGQFVLRQYLHPLACSQHLELPFYYARFHDLRKEYVRAYTLRAVAPTPEGVQPPPPPPDYPSALSEMLDYLNISPYAGENTNVAKVKDMTSVIIRILSDGFQLTLPETVDLVLEFGICSKDDEIDGNCIVRVCGFPYPMSEQDVSIFFRGLNIAKGGVVMCPSSRDGEAFVRFVSQQHRDMALERDSQGVAVRRAAAAQFRAAARARRAQFAARMRGVPRDVTVQQVLEFFTAGDDPIQVLDGVDGVLLMIEEAFVFFGNQEDATRALCRNNKRLGSTCIELFSCTPEEIERALNCLPESIQSQSWSTLPGRWTTDDGLLDQHKITSGTIKNCVRLRGLPYEAQVEHVVTFLAEYVSSIVSQGVHMIHNCEGHPSGDAFIRMDSETIASECAKQKHRSYMRIGKKVQCVEVVQCSGAEMRAALAGGAGALTRCYPERAPPPVAPSV